MSQNKVGQGKAGMAAAKAPEKKKYSAGGYRALAVIVFVLAVGGLFLGLAGSLLNPLSHGEFFTDFEGPLQGSLMGYLIHYVKDIITKGFIAYLQGIWTNLSVSNLSLLLSAVVLAVGVVLSLVLGIISFFTQKKAKTCAMTSAVVVFLGYAGFFLTNLYEQSIKLKEAFSTAYFDVPTAIVAGVLLVLLIAVGVGRRKGLGLINALLMILTLAAIYSVCNAESPFVSLSLLVTLGGLMSDPFTAFSAIALFVLLAFNFVVSAIRLSAQKGYLFDAVRFLLLLVAALLTIWAGEWALFTSQLISSIIALAAPFAAFVIALLVGIMRIVKGKKAPKKNALANAIAPRPAAAAAPKPVSTPAPAPAPAAAPAAAPVAAAANDNVTVHMPPAAPQPVSREPKPQNITVNVHPAMYGQTPMMPYYSMPYYGQQNPPMQQPAPMPAEPAVQEAPKPEPTPVVKEEPQEEPMSEFERRMADLASGVEETPAEEPAPVEEDVPVEYEGMEQDHFLETLTPQEKNEFGDLFIANKHGMFSALPPYVIDGDNRAFFSRVFIYYGKFRSYISTSLLEKLYNYVTQN